MRNPASPWMIETHPKQCDVYHRFQLVQDLFHRISVLSATINIAMIAMVFARTSPTLIPGRGTSSLGVMAT